MGRPWGGEHAPLGTPDPLIYAQQVLPEHLANLRDGPFPSQQATGHVGQLPDVREVLDTLLHSINEIGHLTGKPTIAAWAHGAPAYYPALPTRKDSNG